jgi:hypothetical protein
VPLPPASQAQGQAQQGQQGQAPELALGPGKGGSHGGTPRAQSNGARPGESGRLRRAAAAPARRPRLAGQPAPPPTTSARTSPAAAPASVAAARHGTRHSSAPPTAALPPHPNPPFTPHLRTPAGSGSNPSGNNTNSGSRGAGSGRTGADAGAPPAAALGPKLSLGMGPPDAVRANGPEADGGRRALLPPPLPLAVQPPALRPAQLCCAVRQLRRRWARGLRRAAACGC